MRDLLAANASLRCFCSEPEPGEHALQVQLEDGLTRHAERSPQASGVLLALFQLHPPDPDDLTDQEQSWPHQVAAAQVLEAEVKP